MVPHDPEHDHDPTHGEVPGAAAPHDAAAASLARALRLSFRILSLIMLFVLVLFAFSGMTCIESGQKGIVTVFGRKVAVVGPGLHYTWPFPIGRIEKVQVRQQTLPISVFWMGETPEDKAKPVASRTPSGKGLRPGWDGALLTGDAYLFHVQLECVYEIDDPAAYRSGLEDPNEAIEAAVCRAAVQTAAHRTVEEMVLGEDKGPIVLEIRDAAQDALRQLNAGVTLSRINFIKPNWPLRVLPDAQNAQNASQQERTARERAVQEAKAFLGNAVGPEYRRLVGDPWEETGALVVGAEADSNYNLIGQYEIARRDPNVLPPQCEAILAKIDEILLSLSAQGQVSAILGAANTYKDTRKNAVIARAENLQKLLAEYDKAPDFFLQRLWTEAREEILQSPTVIKWYLNPGEGKTILQINIPPEIIQEIGKWYMTNPMAPPPGRPPAGASPQGPGP